MRQNGPPAPRNRKAPTKPQHQGSVNVYQGMPKCSSPRGEDANKVPMMRPLVLVRKPREGQADWNKASSWLGGLPKLGGASWPRNPATGVPLHFLAQVDLGHVSSMRRKSGLPRHGSLAFFADTDFSQPLEDWAAAVVYVDQHMRAVDTDAPADVPPIYGQDWSAFCKGARNATAAPRTFPRWAADILDPKRVSIHSETLKFILRILRLDTARSEADPYLATKEFIKSRFQPTGYSLSASSVAEYLPRGKEPYLWHSARALSESIYRAIEEAPLSCGHVEKSLSWSVNNLRELESSAAAAEKLKLAQERIEGLATKLANMKSAVPELARLAEETAVWATPHNPWAPISDEDFEQIKRIQEHLRTKFKDLAQFRAILYSYELANLTLQEMACGGQDVYSFLPENVREYIRDHHLAPGNGGWHQMLGIGIEVQSAVWENATNVLLLQLYSDDLMNWMWGDVGALQFWIPPAAVKARDWSKVHITLEGH